MLTILMTALIGTIVACTEQSATPPSSVPPTVAPLAQKAAEQTETVPTLFFPPGFQAEDTRGVELPELVLKDLEQPPIPVFGGHAKLKGVVFGPDGPVEGGVVRLERFVGGRGGYADVPTFADGRWEAADIYGGHYRVRAWKRKHLATIEPQVGFVKDVRDSTEDLSIGVEKHEAKRMQVALDNGNPRLDETVTMLVLYDQEEVNEDGIVGGAPFKDIDIDVSMGDGMELIGEPKGRTGLDGYVRFSVKCKTPGKHDVTVSGDGMSATTTLPECLSADASTTTSESTTTTAAPEPGGDSTTSTTAGPFPIGNTFTTPHRGEIPAGTYVSVTDTRNCATDYELYVFTGWQRRQAVGTIVVAYPARRLTPKEGTPSCTFMRVR